MTAYKYIPNDGTFLTPTGHKLARVIDRFITKAWSSLYRFCYTYRIKLWMSERNNLINELHIMAIRLNKLEDELNEHKNSTPNASEI